MRMAAFWPTRSPAGEVAKVGFGSKSDTQIRLDGGLPIIEGNVTDLSRGVTGLRCCRLQLGPTVAGDESGAPESRRNRVVGS
jgi:hypothetical protein